MMRDLFSYLETQFAWHLAPMGYLAELSGISRRARQCRAAWGPHLANTRAVIADAATSAKPGGTVMIVGSGHLLDVPLDALLARFERVRLVDVFHPRAVRRATSKDPRIELLQNDVTGVSRKVFDHVRRRRTGPLPEPSSNILPDVRADLTVSVNLLSQLSVTPCAYLRAHRPGLPPAALANFERRLINAHLAWLRRCDGRVVLITDVEREERWTDGTCTRRSILADVSLPQPDRGWWWDIAPLGSVYPDRSVRHNVYAFADFTKAATPRGPG